jgi:hypothetical protein
VKAKIPWDKPRGIWLMSLTLVPSDGNPTRKRGFDCNSSLTLRVAIKAASR